MKIALIGYGQMGQIIEKIAISRGHSIVARITKKNWDSKALAQADVCMEFSHPLAALENIKKIAELKKNLVIGTTGWYDNLDEVRILVEKNQIGALYSPNFSTGVQILFEILKHASEIMASFSEYDAAGIECHHAKKQDKPSGTALEITDILEKHLPRKGKIPFSSLRCGSIPGSHAILFDSPFDTITISHEARNREGFAKGAVHAAEWVHGKKGLYTFKDCLKEYFQRSRI